MPRPPVCRRILREESISRWVPVPLRDPEPVILHRDELEAIRLADLAGLYQEQGALQMQVSRATFSRILQSARNKVAIAMLSGRTLIVQEHAPVQTREFSCICNCPRKKNGFHQPCGRNCPTEPSIHKRGDS